MYDKDKLREVPIVEVAEKLNIATKRNGSVLLMHCLWHEDKKPSMVLGGRYNRCHCFACGADHDAVGLVMKELDVDFKEACEWLEREGYEIRTASPPNPSSSAPTERSATLRDVERSHEARGNPFGGRKNVSKIQRLEALQALPLGGGKEPKALGEGLYYFPPDTMSGRMTMANSFAMSMQKVFGANATAEVIRLYQLGTFPTTGRYDDVMFPLINKQGVILDIKVQAYECDERSDRFFHSFKCYWLGKKANEEAEFAHEALFGEHLLNLYPSKTVVLVESPKNACVGAAVYPQYLWVATGNKGMLKREVLEVLRGRKVVVYPDNDAYDEWQQKLRSMQDIALFVCKHTPGDTGEKGDIADWMIASPPLPLNRATVVLSGNCFGSATARTLHYPSTSPCTFTIDTQSIARHDLSARRGGVKCLGAQ